MLTVLKRMPAKRGMLYALPGGHLGFGFTLQAVNPKSGSWSRPKPDRPLARKQLQRNQLSPEW